MNKPDLITKANEIMKENGEKITKKDTATVLDALVKAMVEGVKADGELNLQGVLKLTVSEVPERECYIDPRDLSLGTKIVPAHNIVKAKVGKAFKEAVR